MQTSWTPRCWLRDALFGGISDGALCEIIVPSRSRIATGRSFLPSAALVLQQRRQWHQKVDLPACNLRSQCN